MKISVFCKCSLSLLCVAMLIFLTCFFTVAESAPEFSISAPSSVTSGDTIYVSVSLKNTDKKLSSISFKLKYNPSVFTAGATETTCNINDSNGELVSRIDSNNGTINVAWDTVSSSTCPTGDIFTLGFSVCTVTSQESADFALENVKVFDANNKSVIVVYDNRQTTTIKSIDLGDLSLFTVLEKSDFTLDDIIAAEDAFSNYSSIQVKTLLATHYDLYQLLKDSRTKYYERMEKESTAKIYQQANEFMADPVFNLTVDTVTLGDKPNITELTKKLNALPSNVKAIVPSAYKDKLTDLANTVKSLEKENQAKLEADDFREMYKSLWGLNEDVMASGYEGYASMVTDALFYYDNMSNKSQDQVKDEKEYLNNFYAIVLKCIEKDEASKKLNDEYTKFLEKWKSVVTLSVSSVEVGDKLAIEMMINDIQNQSPELQEKLEMRKALSNKLLDKIATLNKTTSSSNSSPEGEKIVYKDREVTKTVEKAVQPAEDNKQIESADSKKNTKTIIYNKMPTIILVLIILLGISILSLIWPFIRLFKFYSRKKELPYETIEI